MLGATGADDIQEDSPVADRYGLFSDKLAFLAQYRDFHAFFAQGARLEASKLLVGMLSSGLPPKRFYAILLLDSIPLLEDGNGHFDANETFELLRCLQEIDMASDSMQYLVGLGHLILGSDANHTQAELIQAARQQLKIIRLALARYLSRVILEE